MINPWHMTVLIFGSPFIFFIPWIGAFSILQSDGTEVASYCIAKGPVQNVYQQLFLVESGAAFIPTRGLLPIQ